MPKTTVEFVLTGVKNKGEAVDQAEKVIKAVTGAWAGGNEAEYHFSPEVITSDARIVTWEVKVKWESG